MQRAIFFLCAMNAAAFVFSAAAARAAIIDDHGIGYSGYYFNDPMGYREAFTEQVPLHLGRNYPSANNEFFVTFTPTTDIQSAYGISIDDPSITDSELMNGQESNHCPQPFLLFHDGGTAVPPVSPYCGDPMFRGSATGSAWAILYNSGPLPLATSTYHLQAGVSYDVVGWWYSGTPANLVDGQAITIGIWEPDPVAVPWIVTSSLAQYLSDGATAIPERGLVAEGAVVFGATLQSPATGTLQLQVEIEPSNMPFKGQPTATGSFAAAGARATAAMTGLANGDYHWQARVVDAAGNASPWHAIGDPPADTDFVVGRIADILYNLTDRSASIESANGATAPTRSTYGPLNVHVKLGRPLGGSAGKTLALTIDQLATSGCVDPNYRLRGYLDGDYRNTDGPEYIFGNWTDASGASISIRDYTGTITGTASGKISPLDYYALSFGSCDFFRSVSIAAAPGADYVCTNNGGPFNNYCYDSDVAGAPFMTLAAREVSREPVVIVPGIMGSRLNMAVGGTEVWPNASAMILSGGDSYLDALKLSASGTEIPGNEIYPSDIIRTVTTSIPFVGADFYEPLIDAFLAGGYEEGKDLFVAPYDWRLGVADSVGRIGAVVQTAVARAPNGKIDLISHSMGGLVVKAYLARATSTAFLDHLILAGVPQLGAPAVFKDLEYGDDLGFNVLGLVSLLNPREVKSISQNMPGVYALLPTRRYVGIEGSYVFDARGGSTAPFGFDFDRTNQFMTSDPDDSRNDALLAAADAFHAPLDTAAVSAPAVYNLVGCQNPATAKNFILQDGGAVDIVRGNGDGSVPVDSAMNLANGYENYFSLYAENGVDHAGLVRDNRPIALIKAIIQNATATLALAPLGISTSSRDCLQGRSQSHDAVATEVSARGPVMLNVYDDQGRHTGPNGDGGIDLQIPGSSYQAIGPNSFILIPGSNTYRVVAQGSSTGASSSATFTIKQYDDAADPMRTGTYVGIPIASASTTATFVITSSTPAPPISLDSGGGGISAAPVPPTAILDASSSHDHDPPVITVSGLPANAALGATTTVTFSFMDAGTGIATSSAAMNGIPLVSGGTVVFDAVGTATFLFFAEDNAGNPASREYHVSVLPAGGSCRGPGDP